MKYLFPIFLLFFCFCKQPDKPVPVTTEKITVDTAEHWYCTPIAPLPALLSIAVVPPKAIQLTPAQVDSILNIFANRQAKYQQFLTEAQTDFTAVKRMLGR